MATRYKLSNWNECNRFLINRGHVLNTISDDIFEKLFLKMYATRGIQQAYADRITVMLEIFQLPLRQTQGFFENWCATQKKDVAIPNYSTLSQRRLAMGPVQIPIKPSLEREILVDSTGIKTSGDGEWVGQKHPESRRKKWIKCHIAIDAQTQEVVLAPVRQTLSPIVKQRSIILM
jgi:hypothetical protein